MTTDEGNLESKGELFPSKKIREAIGLKKNQRVKYSVTHGRLIIEKILDPITLLSQSPKIEISWKEYKKDRLTLSKELEK